MLPRKDLVLIYDSVIECIGATPWCGSRAAPNRGWKTWPKLEMLNPYGSMKDRPARYIIEQGLAEGSLRPGMRLVESTSGNLGVALAAVACHHGLGFTAVVDPNTTTTNLELLAAYGATVDMVTELDHAEGYLHRRRWKTRIELANSLFEYFEIFHNRRRRHSAPTGCPITAATRGIWSAASKHQRRRSSW